jgi:hypothetical protein
MNGCRRPFESLQRESLWSLALAELLRRGVSRREAESLLRSIPVHNAADGVTAAGPAGGIIFPPRAAAAAAAAASASAPAPASAGSISPRLAAAHSSATSLSSFWSHAASSVAAPTAPAFVDDGDGGTAGGVSQPRAGSSNGCRVLARGLAIGSITIADGSEHADEGEALDAAATPTSSVVATPDRHISRRGRDIPSSILPPPREPASLLAATSVAAAAGQVLPRKAPATAVANAAGVSSPTPAPVPASEPASAVVLAASQRILCAPVDASQEAGAKFVTCADASATITSRTPSCIGACETAAPPSSSAPQRAAPVLPYWYLYC